MSSRAIGTRWADGQHPNLSQCIAYLDTDNVSLLDRPEIRRNPPPTRLMLTQRCSDRNAMSLRKSELALPKAQDFTAMKLGVTSQVT